MRKLDSAAAGALGCCRALARKQAVFFKKTKPIVERCETDMTTRLRLKYAPFYHVAESADGVNVTVDGRPMVIMSSNEYLGLSRHPRVVEAAKRAVDQWGASACGSRLANGSRPYHVDMEEALAAFLGKEACHVTAAGYLACTCSLSSLAQRGDALIVDPSIHSSLWDGALLSGAKIERFAHNDMESLAKLLEQLDPKQAKVIVVDGVYSMEGHLAPLPRLVELAEEHQAVVVVDEAHSIGILGKDGRGVCDHFGVTGRVELICGSFSKAFASTGGFVAGSRAMVEYLRTNSRQIIFSAAISPAATASARAALEIMQSEPEHRERLWANYRRLKAILENLGLDFWDSQTPALPIVVGDRMKCYALWQSLWERGFFTVISVPPGVPAGKDLVRCAVTALHTPEQLDRFGEALKAGMKQAGVPPRR
ncbi:MAG: aminotransferase class I/II-fold pyridoxal phosphate-dependent enzyme [Verrucomicrobia bacterium]|nr:aminotransferase class I/II-fold pyridoxal phosphate-dependent enzyme [Verrucomicrobiota bacterium]